MSERGDKIAFAAESMVGVPFKHQGRNPKSGVDCVGVVLCSVWSAGCEMPDCLGYGPLPRSEVLLRELECRAQRIHLDDAEPGDVLLFQYRVEIPMHFAVLSFNNHVVHAHGSVGKVVKHRMSPSWSMRLHSVWRAEGTNG